MHNKEQAGDKALLAMVKSVVTTIIVTFSLVYSASSSADECTSFFLNKPESPSSYRKPEISNADFRAFAADFKSCNTGILNIPLNLTQAQVKVLEDLADSGRRAQVMLSKSLREVPPEILPVLRDYVEALTKNINSVLKSNGEDEVEAQLMVLRSSQGERVTQGHRHDTAYLSANIAIYGKGTWFDVNGTRHAAPTGKTLIVPDGDRVGPDRATFHGSSEGKRLMLIIHFYNKKNRFF